MRRSEVRRCEDEKMRDSPPLLEEPCAQTLSGKIERSNHLKTTLIHHKILPDSALRQLGG
jgi:hypothetical protein